MRNVPSLICSIRTETPYPCIGSRASVFRISMSNVPCTRSLGWSPIRNPSPDNQEEDTLLILIVKRRGDSLQSVYVSKFHRRVRLRPSKKAHLLLGFRRNQIVRPIVNNKLPEVFRAVFDAGYPDVGVVHDVSSGFPSEGLRLVQSSVTLLPDHRRAVRH